MTIGTAFIHNAATGRIHAAYFTEAPLPGGSPPTRWRSRAHHTVGAATQGEADAHMAAIRDLFPDDSKHSLGHFEWDGEGVPALVVLTGEVQP